jgi:predicted ATPase
MILTNLEIKHFKKIEQISIELSPINILVGGNNSGKTCVLQAAHFGISVLQSGRFVQQRYGLTPSTLSSEQLRYIPTDDLMRLRHNRAISQNHGIEIIYSGKTEKTDEPNPYKLSIRRGKNANLSISFPHNHEYHKNLSDPQNPFSIYVPGLAGIPLREEYRADSVITSGISRGDANLFLRNVLLRLQKNREKMALFHEIFRSIFPDVHLEVEFLDSQDMYINCFARVSGQTLSIDMLGTGVLRVIQLVAYVVNYNPSILLLDEPDSHLHPDNQRKLGDTLLKIAETTNTKILLATHSRHLLDSFHDSEECRIIWMKNGQVQPEERASDINVLLDLGALDSGEKLLHGHIDAVILTEDTKYANLETLLKANDIPRNNCFIFPYKGVSRVDSAVAITSFLSRIRPGIPVIFHRDADFATNEERELIKEKYRELENYNCHIFITKDSDIEHYFCTDDHIAHIYGISEERACAITQAAIDNDTNHFIRKYMRKRDHMSSTLYSNPRDAPSTESLLPSNGIRWEQCLGKLLFKKIKQRIETDLDQVPDKLANASDALEDIELKRIRDKIWGPSTSGR